MKRSTRRGLESVATGLGLVYAGLCLLVLSVLVVLIVPALTRTPGLDIMIYLPQSVMSLAIGMDVGGRLCCLRMPADRAAARPIILVSVVSSLAGLLLIPLLLIPNVRVQLPQFMPAVQLGLTALGAVLFILFLRILAERVKRKDLVRSAINLLIVGSVAVAVILGLVMTGGLGGDQILIPLVGLVVGIVVLIMYGNLLTYLRQAIRSYVAMDTSRTGLRGDDDQDLPRPRTIRRQIDDDVEDNGIERGIPERRPRRAKRQAAGDEDEDDNDTGVTRKRPFPKNRGE